MASKLLKKKKQANRFIILKNLNKKKLLLYSIVVLFVLIGYRIYKNNSSIYAETTAVQRKDLIESITASGEISAEERVDLNFLTAGEMSSITVKEGDVVQKGQIIARLNSTNLYQAYLQAEANLRKADASLALVYNQIQGHADDETFEQRDIRTTTETARDVAYRAFVQASENLSYAVLRAPFSGLIAFITEGMAPGFYVTPATAKIIIVNPETAVFMADVNEVNISAVYLGQKVNIVLDAYPDDEIKGVVTHIGVTAVTTSTGGTAYPVEVNLPGSIGLKHKIGMNGDAEFVLDNKENVITVPLTALVEEDDKEYVWISIDGIARKVEIMTGLSSVTDVEITEGLEEGQIIVTRPPVGIQDGKKIIERN